MAVVRTSRVDLQINGDGAYAFVAQPGDGEKPATEAWSLAIQFLKKHLT